MSIDSNSMKSRKAGLRRNGLSAAVLMLGTFVGPAHSAHAVVPWLNQPAPAQAASTQASVPAALRPCTAADLQIVLGQNGARHGFATQEIRLSNTSADACTIAGIPDTQILPDNEAPQTLGAHDPTATLGTTRVDLGAGQDAVLLIGTPGSCEAATKPQRKVATRMQLALPGGGVKMLHGAHVDTLCGRASVLRFEAFHHNTPAVAGLSATGNAHLTQLTGVVAAPDTVNRGDTLRYTVTLSNPTAAPVSLAACPAYTQSFYADGKIVSNTLRLNCAATGTQIAAKSSVTYEMQLPLQADLPAGGAKLSWTLQNGPSVGTLLDLR